MSALPHILIVGGGFVGLSAARRLEQLLDAGAARVTLVNPENFMSYQPLLPELSSGAVEARHAVVPLRRALGRTRLLCGHLTALDHARRVATVRPYAGDERELSYDHVVIGLGSRSLVLPVPGLAEQAIGFQTLPEALALRDRVLERMEAAEATDDVAVRRRALTFVVVGGGYTGVEVLAELEDMARVVARTFTTLRRADMRWVLVEATDRILPTVQERLAARAVALLRGRGIEVHLDTVLESAQGGRVRLSSGEEFETDTLVWVAGVAPHSLVDDLGLPLTDAGLLDVDEFLRLRDVDGAWAAGDCAAVPDARTGGTCPPTAQFAEREGLHLGDNLAALVRGNAPRPFRYRSRGEFVTLGRNTALAQIGRLHATGRPVWLARRLYYASRIPTPGRKVRLLVEWGLDAVFDREVVQLGSARRPREPFAEAVREDRSS